MIKWKRYGWTVKDEDYRSSYNKPELSKNILKSLLSSVGYNFYYKMYFEKKFHAYSYKTAISKYRRYCMFTYSGKVVFRQFKLGRHTAKQMASLGYLSGLRKSSF